VPGVALSGVRLGSVAVLREPTVWITAACRPKKDLVELVALWLATPAESEPYPSMLSFFTSFFLPPFVAYFRT
jgi:hypothetical protein